MTPPLPYLLGDGPDEIRHLVEQARVYAPETDDLLGQIGLGRGASAIDIGCGVMGVLHVLAARVGPTGRVVGVDREPRFLAHARAAATGQDLAVELVSADAAATGLPSGEFDLVHTRSLLLNVEQPEQVVAEMLRLARPGGTVLVQEPDSSAWTCDPPHPAFARLRSEIGDAYRRTGKDLDIGRRSARLLRDAGLQDVRARPVARVTAAGDYFQTFLLTIAGLVRDVIVDGGRLTAAALDADITALQAHLEAPGTATCPPLMWQAWGRVPDHR